VAKEGTVVSLGEAREFTVAEALVWAAATGSTFAARAALVARPLTKSGSMLCVIRRIVAESKAHTKFDSFTAVKFLKHPLFSGGPVPKLEKGKRKVYAPASAGASTDLPLDDAPAAKRPASNLVQEARHALTAHAGDARAHAHIVELHNEEMAQNAEARQLARALRESAEAEEERDWADTFAQFDPDGDGALDHEELVALLRMEESAGGLGAEDEGGVEHLLDLGKLEKG
jgi:hypothetical protein